MRGVGGSGARVPPNNSSTNDIEFDAAYFENELKVTQEALEDIEQRLQDAMLLEGGDNSGGKRGGGGYEYDDYDGFDYSSGHLQHDDNNEDDEEDNDNDNKKDQSLVQKLGIIQNKAAALRLVQDVITWMKGSSSASGRRDDNDQEYDSEEEEEEDDDLVTHTVYVELGELLLRHDPMTIIQVVPELFHEKYLPLFDYLHGYYVSCIKYELDIVARYPTSNGCSQLARTCRRRRRSYYSNKQKRKRNDTTPGTDSSSKFPLLCRWLIRIEALHANVMKHMNDNDDDEIFQSSSSQSTSVVVKLLLESIVERIQYHFLTPSPDRPSTTRNDRFIEWFLAYIQEQVLGISSNDGGGGTTSGGGGSPWQVVVELTTAMNSIATMSSTSNNNNNNKSSSLTQPNLNVSYAFMIELFNILVYVIQSKRNIFRCVPQMVGRDSNPNYIMNSIQELFQFDSLLQNVILPQIQHLQDTLPARCGFEVFVKNNNDTNDDGAGGGDTDDGAGFGNRSNSRSLSYPTTESAATNTTTANNIKLPSLVTTIVACDTELFQWFLQREREVIFTTLLEDSNIIRPSMNCISPRAEIFCSLIKSIQCKSSLFQQVQQQADDDGYDEDTTDTSVFDPGAEYVRYIAVPLCTAFVDAIHEASTDLRNLLFQQPIGMMGGRSSSLVNLDDLSSNIQEWIELINGTHMSGLVLIRQDDWHKQQQQPPQSSRSQQQQQGIVPAGGSHTTTRGKSWTDHDLARFGQSLERLEMVLVEEFAASFVETILMDRAKLASYLMMASHVLASENWGDDGDDDDFDNGNPMETSFGGGSTKQQGVEGHDELSPELKETNVVLAQFLNVCDKAVGPRSGDSNGQRDGDGDVPSDLPSQVVRFAPSAMRDHVLNRLADKFMEVALDVHSVTPDIYQTGATVFARDVRTILGGSVSGDECNSSSYNELPLLQRLLDLTRLMSMNTSSLQGLAHALGGLTGGVFLDPEDFASDGTLQQEAMSMIQAKGFKWLELDDVISVLNRRRDL